MNVAIIGCGLIGEKRAKALINSAQLVACTDVNFAKAKQLANMHPKAVALKNWQEVIEHPDIDIIIIATPHHVLAEITLAAVIANKHVLVEKPAARFTDELIPVLNAVKKSNVCVRVGFNHRYHRAFRQAYQLIKEGVIDKLMYIRARYGHGGRLGYEKEWRANPQISGGGELIDQGVHLIDLSRWLLGDFVSVQGFAHTYFWDMPVEDNGFLLLKTDSNQVAFLHASCTEWKNLFSMEIYGKKGKIEINGLGGSYGVERLALYQMSQEMGPPETTIWEYPMADDSWATEFNEFLEDIRLKRQPSANLFDAKAALEIVETIYKNNNYDYYT